MYRSYRLSVAGNYVLKSLIHFINAMYLIFIYTASKKRDFD